MPVVRAVSEHTSTAIPTVAHSSTSTVVAAVTQPATAMPSQSQRATLPVGIIAGSVVGGVMLAVIAVLGWAYWGNALQRHHKKQTSTVLTTKDNLRRHTSQRVRPQRKPFSIRSSEKKRHIEHSAIPESVSEKRDTYDTETQISIPYSSDPSSHSSSPSLAPSKPTKLSTGHRTLRKNRKRKHRLDRKPTLSPIADVDTENAEFTLLEGSPANEYTDENAHRDNLPPFSVCHKPSTIGSASVYSTQSGEERQFGVPSNSVLAALIPPGLDSPVAHPPPSITHKPSNVSSVYSNQSGEERQTGALHHFLGLQGPDRRRFSSCTRSSGSLYSTAEEQQPPPSAWARPLVRHTGGISNGPQPSRLSEVSSASLNSRQDNYFAAGVAYGGDDEV